MKPLSLFVAGAAVGVGLAAVALFGYLAVHWSPGFDD